MGSPYCYGYNCCPFVPPPKPCQFCPYGFGENCCPCDPDPRCPIERIAGGNCCAPPCDSSPYCTGNNCCHKTPAKHTCDSSPYCKGNNCCPCNDNMYCNPRTENCCYNPVPPTPSPSTPVPVPVPVPEYIPVPVPVPSPTPISNCYEVCYGEEDSGAHYYGGKGGKGGYYGGGGFSYGGKGGKGSKSGYYNAFEEDCEIICDEIIVPTPGDRTYIDRPVSSDSRMYVIRGDQVGDSRYIGDTNSPASSPGTAYYPGAYSNPGTAYYPGAYSNPGTAYNPDLGSIRGGDSDEYGCISSAGYSWCASLSTCLRPFETNCPAVGQTCYEVCYDEEVVSNGSKGGKGGKGGYYGSFSGGSSYGGYGGKGGKGSKGGYYSPPSQAGCEIFCEDYILPPPPCNPAPDCYSSVVGD